ncbi:TPA: MFS transporter, partial [Neisseria gonorrhoeae]
GTIVAVIVMCLLPNAGSLGLSTSAALWFGAIAILFMDLSSNMSMQPFKMMISDMVNIAQKDTAWSWQTIWSNIGGVFATILPTILTIIGIKNTASKGIVPDSVILSFYIGALILIVTSIFTICNVH